MVLRVRPPGNAATWTARAIGSAVLRKRSCAGADAPQVDTWIRPLCSIAQCGCADKLCQQVVANKFDAPICVR
jgi:hypothetical protein